jgi:hypothetical protein
MMKRKFIAIHPKHTNRVQIEHIRDENNPMLVGTIWRVEGKEMQYCNTSPSRRRKCVECGEKTNTLFFEI